MIRTLLDNNMRWASARVRAEPDFFRRLAAQQAPEYLWIGCTLAMLTCLRISAQRFPGAGGRMVGPLGAVRPRFADVALIGIGCLADVVQQAHDPGRCLPSEDRGERRRQFANFMKMRGKRFPSLMRLPRK